MRLGNVDTDLVALAEVLFAAPESEEGKPAVRVLVVITGDDAPSSVCTKTLIEMLHNS
jgi:hypothetical protein